MTKRSTEAAEPSMATVDSGAAEQQPKVEPQPAAQENRSRSDRSGFYCYIGPNLNKLIQTGTIFRGTREEALSKAEAAIQAQPLVKTLIVSGDALPAARLKVKTPGNVLYANYRTLAGKEGNHG